MSNILVICGHGQGVYNWDPGCTHGDCQEADYVRRFAQAMQQYDGGLIDYIVDKNVYDYDSRGYGLFAGFAQAGYEAIIELHVDSATASAEDGHVIILTGYEPDALDYRIRDVLEKHVGAQRGDWNGDGIPDGIDGRDNLWNVSQAAAYGLNYRLVELGFMSNDTEREYIYNHIDEYARDMVGAILDIQVQAPQPQPDILYDMPIIGQQYLDAQTMADYALSKNPNPRINCSMLELAQFYLDEGKSEGVRGDIAFCQSLHETGYFKYGGQVLPEQNNFSGLGATNNSSVGKGAWFDTPQLGVRAQIQHLKGYASTEPLKNAVVDTRYQILVDNGLLGRRTTWKALSGSWAYPGYPTDIYSSLEEAIANSGDYGSTIIKTYVDMRRDYEPITPEHDNVPDDWAKEAWEKMSELKLLDGTRPRDAITRQEVAIIMKRLYDAGAIDVEKLHK